MATCTKISIGMRGIQNRRLVVELWLVTCVARWLLRVRMKSSHHTRPSAPVYGSVLQKRLRSEEGISERHMFCWLVSSTVSEDSRQPETGCPLACRRRRFRSPGLHLELLRDPPRRRALHPLLSIYFPSWFSPIYLFRLLCHIHLDRVSQLAPCQCTFVRLCLLNRVHP
jgi:hypothetical protein